jgi:propionyl-CoA carboxylase alpha chain
MDKVLIANRGEIAVRVIRACREQSLRPVAVYSDADATALHVRRAAEAYRLGPPAAAASYLDQDKVLAVADRSGADAIHPGYGFLSENAAFAEAVREAGFTWIGPPPEAIRQMGDKTAARALMEDAGVPMAPGTTDAIADADEAVRVASGIGFPVLVKAAAGGGGKGMRIVREEEALAGAVQRAQSEAESAFGDGRVFVEKYIEAPRHIEFQILADRHGHTTHLFERECSIQRRHQKVIEEAPSSVLSPKKRREMGEAAVAAAEAVGYENAGTVEFLVDAELDFYFMEMNTRLQVEHPTTEMVTGIDLVAEQLRVARGEELGYAADDLSIDGHAVECRVYAEDPAQQFLPDPGELVRHAPPDGPGVRTDAGVEEGETIPVHYDPMISKLVCWGASREAAIRRTERALAEYEVTGVETTIPFCRYAMRHAAFRSGDFSTHFVEEHFDPARLFEGGEGPQAARDAAVAAVLFRAAQEPDALDEDDGPRRAGGGASSRRSRWAKRRRR